MNPPSPFIKAIAKYFLTLLALSTFNVIRALVKVSERKDG